VPVFPHNFVITYIINKCIKIFKIVKINNEIKERNIEYIQI